MKVESKRRQRRDIEDQGGCRSSNSAFAGRDLLRPKGAWQDVEKRLFTFSDMPSSRILR